MTCEHLKLERVRDPLNNLYECLGCLARFRAAMASEGVQGKPPLTWHRNGTTSQAKLPGGWCIYRVFPSDNGTFELHYATDDGTFRLVDIFRNRTLAKKGAEKHYATVTRNRGVVLGHRN